MTQPGCVHPLPSVSSVRPSLVSLRARLGAAVADDAARGRSLHGRDGSAEIRAGLAGLPELQGDLMLLLGVGGYPLREAAEITGLTPAQALREALSAMQSLGCAHRQARGTHDGYGL